MRFLHLIRPVMCILPEVAQPDRKVRNVRVIFAHVVVVMVSFFVKIVSYQPFNMTAK